MSNKLLEMTCKQFINVNMNQLNPKVIKRFESSNESNNSIDTVIKNLTKRHDSYVIQMRLRNKLKK